MTEPLSPEDQASGLRDQAASCRRLARRATTPTVSTALEAAAEQFDHDARRIDPRSERR